MSLRFEMINAQRDIAANDPDEVRFRKITHPVFWKEPIYWLRFHLRQYFRYVRCKP